MLGVSPLERYSSDLWNDDDVEMLPWAKREYTSGQYNQAGKFFIDFRTNDVSDEAIDAANKVNNWRSLHSLPLTLVRRALQRSAKLIDPNAVVAQRIKRFPSITSKLISNPNMQLTQMQDIGGCRAIVANMQSLVKLMEWYRPRQSQIANKTFDYITSPKASGYRSFHVVVKYQSKSGRYKPFDGFRIEVQLRTKLQHCWATAVEIIDMFTDQNLKSGGGNNDWKRFFALASRLFGFLEQTPNVPGTSPHTSQVVSEFRVLHKTLHADMILRTAAGLTYIAEKGQAGASRTFLIKLDLEKRLVSSTGFSAEEEEQGFAEYVATEKAYAGNDSFKCVWVEVGSLEEVRLAYPNYFMDTSIFLSMLDIFIEGSGSSKPIKAWDPEMGVDLN